MEAGYAQVVCGPSIGSSPLNVKSDERRKRVLIRHIFGKNPTSITMLDGVIHRLQAFPP